MADDDQERLEASVRMVLEAILSKRRAQAAQAATDGSREAPQAPRRPLEARKPMPVEGLKVPLEFVTQLVNGGRDLFG